MALREFEAIIAYVARTGVPHRVTSTTGGQHAPGSYHYKGCAVDLAEPKPSRNTPGLLAIFAAFGPVEGQLAELIYSGAPYGVKNGKRVPRYAVANHYDHVHVAVKPGTFLVPTEPKPLEVSPMYDPPFRIAGAVVASLNAPAGGAWVLTEDGAIYAFGCPDLDAPNRHPEYWNIPGQKAARLEEFHGGYTVVDNVGRRYNYPAS